MKLLLIDDEAPVREILGLSLRSEGYEVMTAASGKEGIEIFRRENPPIVLTDIKMPGMDGSRIYEKIKMIDSNLARRIVFITGNILNKETQAFLEKTGALNLPKPFSINELKDIIYDALNV